MSPTIATATAPTVEAGDSCSFDADAPHGPEELVELALRFLSVIAQPPDQGDRGLFASK